MPHVLIQHRKELLENSRDPSVFCNRLKDYISRWAADTLSVPERHLSIGDFSFMFMEAGPYDKLIHDIQVIIFAHADEVRVEKADPLAEHISNAVAEVVAESRWKQPYEGTHSVSLCLSEMGYHSSPYSWSYTH